MARTNGPTVPHLHQRPDQQGAGRGYAQSSPGHAPAGSHAQAGDPRLGAYNQAQPSGHAPYPSQPAYPAPADAYHYPGSYGAEAYSQPTLTNQDPHGYQNGGQPQWGDPAANAGYAPRFESYSPAAEPNVRTQPPQHSAPAYAPPEHVPPSHGYAAASEYAQQPEWQQPQLRGATYDQHPQWQRQPAADAYGAQHAPQQYSGYPQGYAEQAPGQADVRGWQGYHQDAGAQHGYPEPSLGDPPAFGGHGYAPPPGYPPESYAAEGYAPEGYRPPGYGEADPRFAPHDGYGLPAEAQSHDLEHEYDPDEVEYEDGGRTGSRKMLIAAAVISAVVVSGGLAFGYKALFSSGGGDAPPVIKSEGQPSKIKPIDPGGKKFAHTDSKILGRLNDGSSPESESAGAGSEEGPRKVTTMIVGRDGSIVPATNSPPPSAETAEAPAARPVVVSPPSSASVPGLTIVDGFGGRGVPAASAPPPRAPSPPPAALPKPQVLARVEPVAPSAPPRVPAAAAEVKPVQKKPVRQALATINSMRDAGTAAGPASSPAKPAGASIGFVAVLASVPASSTSRMDALKQFADLQQRYPSQLQNKTPDVQEATLASKGTYHRLVVGPPGSRKQATDLCAELKVVGYTSCWIKSY